MKLLGEITQHLVSNEICLQKVPEIFPVYMYIYIYI